MAPPSIRGLELVYDSIEVADIPAHARNVAGYVDGAWPTSAELRRRFPQARVLTIATSPRNVAQFLDVEAGDGTLADVVPWLERALAAGVKRPGIYASLAAWPELLRVCRAAGWPRPRIKVWIAHWNDRQHVCSPSCGFGLQTNAGATQFSGPAAGRHYDVSVATPLFLNS